MGSMSIWHWLVVLAIVLLLFGRGRLSDIMGEFGKGVNSFKKGIGDNEKRLAEPDPAVVAEPQTVTPRPEGEPRQG